jgi:integrase
MVNEQLVDSFRKWLFTHEKLHNNTVAKHLKKLRKYILLAKRYNHPVTDVSMKIKELPSTRLWLTKEELSKFDNLYTQELPNTLKITLHYFLLSCYTSLRISDKHQINTKNIDGNILTFKPEKTQHINKEVKIFLTEKAMHYVNLQLEHQYKPYSNPKLNQYLKEIVSFLGIDKKISFHSARHTFAYHYILGQGKVEVLQQILGHSSITTTMIYTHVDIEAQKIDAKKMDEYYSSINPTQVQ